MVDKKKIMNVKDLTAAFQKDMGDTVASYGGMMSNPKRIPTGLFGLDYALGGGLPRGRCSMIYGPESSGKTNLIFRAIANHQRLWPDLTCVFIAIEGFDKPWAKKMGVDVDKLVVLYPSYAEQAVDMAEAYLYSPDCGIVAIDSLAAMITTSEAEASADRANVGGNGLVTGKLVRRTTLAMNEAEKEGRSPTLLYINQTRFKVGIVYGDPETTPGGNAPKFQSALTLRVSGKNIMDSKVSQVLPIAKEISFMIKKNKVPILEMSGKTIMWTQPVGGAVIGSSDDWNQVLARLKSTGQVVKDEKKGWLCLGSPFPTLAAFENEITADPGYYLALKDDLINRSLAESDALLAGDGVDVL